MPGPTLRRTARLMAYAVAAVLSVSVLGLAALDQVATRKLEKVPRVEVFGSLDERQRPSQPRIAQGSLTMLLVGSDRRSDLPTTGKAARATWQPGAQRTDTIMLVHITADRDTVHLVSLPRDSWVDVPGHGMAKINAAYSWGGAPLLVRTVEQLTQVRVDHLAVIDFAGFRSMTDAVGGVEVKVPRTTYDPRHDRTWTAGRHLVRGEDALDFVRQRYGLPNGDLDRIERQQQFLQALGDKVTSRGVLTNPLALSHLLDSVADTLTVDERLDASRMRDLALSLRSVDPDEMTLATAPVSGFGRRGAQSVVLLDRARSRALFTAMRNDRMGAYVRAAGAE